MTSTSARAYTGFTSFRKALATLPVHTRTASAVLKDQHIKDALQLLRDLQRPLAKEILNVLNKYPEGVSVNDIAKRIPRRKSGNRYSIGNTTQLLLDLRRHCVIEFIQVGKEHIYKVNKKTLRRVQRALHRFCHPLASK